MRLVLLRRLEVVDGLYSADNIDDCWNELTDINEREIFVYAFKLGMRIAIEIFCECKN